MTLDEIKDQGAKEICFTDEFECLLDSAKLKCWPEVCKRYAIEVANDKVEDYKLRLKEAVTIACLENKSSHLLALYQITDLIDSHITDESNIVL